MKPTIQATTNDDISVAHWAAVDACIRNQQMETAFDLLGDAWFHGMPVQNLNSHSKNLAEHEIITGITKMATADERVPTAVAISSCGRIGHWELALRLLEELKV
jgi:hypothetical protein